MRLSPSQLSARWAACALLVVTLGVAAAQAAPKDRQIGPRSPARRPEVKPDAEARPALAPKLPLDELRAALAHEDFAHRRQVVRQLLDAQPRDAPHLDELLHRDTKTAAEDYKNVLRAVGALVPDRNGRFPRPDKGKDAVDWLEALLALEPARLAPALRPALPETLLSVALMRALSGSRHPDAAVSLLRFAYRHQGAFKDECGRQLRQMGTYAVPGLLRARVLDDPLAYKMVRYADYQLDRMNCARPDLALEKAERSYRAELLRAYGEVRDPSAVSAVLKYADDDSHRVRRAARWAMLRYVSGRRPEAIKRKLKLPGGRQTEREKALYLTYHQLATHALAKRLHAELAADRSSAGPVPSVEELSKERQPRALAERLFALFDRRREAATRRRFEEALARARGGDRLGGLAQFDAILADEPYHHQREAMAPFYYERGVALSEAKDHQRAALMLTKAIHLAPKSAFVPDAKARRLVAEVLSDDSKLAALDKEWRLRAALKLAPELTLAQSAYHQLLTARARRTIILWAIGGSSALLALFGLALIRRRVLRWPKES